MDSNFMTYRGAKLVSYSQEHDKQTISWLNHPDVYENFGLTKHITIESHRKWIDSQQHYYIWAIYDDENIHRGNVSLQHNPRHNSAYFQMYIGDKNVRGKGLGFSALVCAVKYAFETLKVHRLWLQVFPENKAAIHIYQKVGFTQEGIEREANFFNRTYRDQLRFSLLDSEWKRRKGDFT